MPVYRVVAAWDEFPGAPDRSRSLQGIAVSESGEVFVADAGNCRVEVYSKEGAPLRQWGRCGDEPGEMGRPVDVALGTQGEVYVADFLLDRITVFDRQGKVLRYWGRAGDQPGEFNSPAGVAIDREGVVYVTEFYGHRLQKLTAAGDPLEVWGEDGHELGQLHYPSKVVVARAVDSEGRIHVADSANRRVQLLSSDGAFVAEWRVPDAGEDGVQTPQGVALGPDGSLYVSDNAASRIYKLRPPKGKKS